MPVKFGHPLLALGIAAVVVIAACVSQTSEETPTETIGSSFSVGIHPYEVNGTHFVNFTVTLNGTTFGPYTLEGKVGGDVPLKEGILLYAGYPNETSKPTEFLLVEKSGRVVWRKRFPGFTEFWASTEGKGIFVKQGSRNPRINPVLYLVDMETGRIVLSRELPGGGRVGDIVLRDGAIYLATSTGYVHMVEDDKLRLVYFDSLSGAQVSAELHLAATEEYVAVAYRFTNGSGERKGLCLFTPELERLACRELEKRPSGVKIEGNTVYVISPTGSVPYPIEALTDTGQGDNQRSPTGGTTMFACPPSLRILKRTTEDTEYYTHFTLQTGNRTVNVTLKGPDGKRMCTPEGVLVYTYYPGESTGGEGVFFDHNLSILWERELPAIPSGYQNGSIVLVLSDEYIPQGCVYFLDPLSGEETFQFCPDEYKFYITDVKVVGEEVYIAGASLFSGDAFIYALRGNETKKVFVASAGEHLLGVRVRLRVSGEYIRVTYGLSGWTGEADVFGHCVFRRDDLSVVECTG
ncbi:PQQ-like beta-propeller repeat protein [Thermococcus thermotolerans]|uniref:PQQ-like beta-propeller repeat protein n=1 Tax=Thermococcus thermotolerans TaxID=2969672 RepID=UPI0021573FCF|nr:PQQ-like beta-propeller repeat protein [Thermococcus thermotolerans]